MTVKPAHQCESSDEYENQFPAVIGFDVERDGDTSLNSVLVHVEYLDGSMQPQIGVNFEVKNGTASIKRIQDGDKQWSQVKKCVSEALNNVGEVPSVEYVESPW